ncbi:MAG: protein-L-isoaspartate(D-aspartate) O-methyltransferase [Kiloniellales bacterium]|nr:protein-L-isoaspartate(D-aspartate) O-methyltransferase [Kiloniellales bacterium]
MSADVSEDEGDRLARARMVEIIAAEVAETSRWLGKERLDPGVMAAMAEVPRHAFVPAHSRGAAYENRPLPIGHGQTISQPYIVAIMTDLSGAGPGRKVLEVGTGCGYQAAVLAATGARVWTIETVPELAEQAALRLAELGYDGVQVRQDDGSKGWPEEAPFDGILVTAAASRRPPAALIEQLAPGGRLVIPVEHRAARLSLFGGAGDQELLVIVKNDDGSLSESCRLPVAFVPLIEGIEDRAGAGDT